MRRWVEENERPAFWVGVGLIASSFVVYPLYAVIAVLPVPLQLKIIGAVMGSLASWGVFFLGTMLAGRRGVLYVKSWFRRGQPPLEPPPRPPLERPPPLP